jgi:hypothetical protein
MPVGSGFNGENSADRSENATRQYLMRGCGESKSAAKLFLRLVKLRLACLRPRTGG